MMPALHTLKASFIYVLICLSLVSCSGLKPQDAFANSSTLTTPSSSPPSPTKPPLPTATAAAFELQATSTPLPSPIPISVQATTVISTIIPLANINPLTGLPVSDPALLERRPMAIKVTKFPRSVRPEWGLSLADNVYNYYIGDQMTRFIGVFYGTDASRVGPVRSARYFDENIIRMYKAIFVFGSADPRVLDPWLESDIKKLLVLERPDNCPPLCRIGPTSDYNTLFADTSKLNDYITTRWEKISRQDLSGLSFNTIAPFTPLAGTTISTRYTFVSYNRWEFDPGSNRYLRFEESQDEQQGQQAYLPLIDSLTEKQLAADNVVVLLIPHKYEVNTATTEMVSVNFIGKGRAYAFREGKIYPVQWERTAPEALLSLENLDGSPYRLKPGNTWFEVIGTTSDVEQQLNGSWSFGFRIP
jgi:hypothetical protein